MSNKISIAVMAHIARKKYFDYLKEGLGNVPFAIDDGTKKNLWENCKDAWNSVDKSKEWGLVLQDDSILCKNFYPELNRILEEIGDRDYIISLYAGNRMRLRIDRAIEKKHNYVIDTKIYNENALCIRTKWIEEMLRFCDLRNPLTDKMIQTYARRKELRIYYPVPSIVDHRVDVSIYRSRFEKPLPNSVRQAYWFIDAEKRPRTNEY